MFDLYPFGGYFVFTRLMGKLEISVLWVNLMKQVLSVPEQLGPLLQSARRVAGLSQTELASRMGLSQSRMSHMEMNPGSISVDQLLAIFGLLRLELVVQDKASPKRPAGTASEW